MEWAIPWHPKSVVPTRNTPEPWASSNSFTGLKLRLWSDSVTAYLIRGQGSGSLCRPRARMGRGPAVLYLAPISQRPSDVPVPSPQPPAPRPA